MFKYMSNLYIYNSQQNNEPLANLASILEYLRVLLNTGALVGSVVNVFHSPRELPWVVVVAGDCHLHWLLVIAATAGSRGSLTQHACASVDLCDWAEALLHSVIVMVLDAGPDWSVSLTETLGWCQLIIFSTFSLVEDDWLTVFLAGPDSEYTLRLKCLLGSWAGSATHWVHLVTDRHVRAVFFWGFCFIFASLKASPALFEFIRCWNSHSIFILRWDFTSGTCLHSNTTGSTLKVTMTKW